MNADPFTEIFLILFKLVTGGLALVLATFIGRWLDSRAGITFADTLQKMTPGQRAEYLKFRWLGICIVVGACFF